MSRPLTCRLSVFKPWPDSYPRTIVVAAVCLECFEKEHMKGAVQLLVPPNSGLSFLSTLTVARTSAKKSIISAWLDKSLPTVESAPSQEGWEQRQEKTQQIRLPTTGRTVTIHQTHSFQVILIFFTHFCTNRCTEQKPRKRN